MQSAASQQQLSLKALLDHVVAQASCDVWIGYRGDGVVVVSQEPVLDVLDVIAGGLMAKVAEFNGSGDIPRMRVRMAVHEGYIDEAVPRVDDAVGITVRLNDSEVVSATLAAADRADGVIAVSDPVYQGVVRPGFRRAVEGHEYGRALHDTAGSDQVWLRTPGYPRAPGEALWPPQR
ncbi:hypothetical protein ACIGO9_31805 [Nocardia asteroides]|uniref:hypothetical protein n=1 Tax=Nocardia asteroides TaxID=1824 RepID=UPI0037CC37DD